MGGALILVTVLGSTLLWADLDSRYVWVALITDDGLRRDWLD